MLKIFEHDNTYYAVLNDENDFARLKEEFTSRHWYDFRNHSYFMTSKWEGAGVYCAEDNPDLQSVSIDKLSVDEINAIITYATQLQTFMMEAKYGYIK